MIVRPVASHGNRYRQRWHIKKRNFSNTGANMNFRKPLAVAFLVAWVHTAQAQDWGRFRGNQSDGRSSDTNLISEWPKEGPELLWTATGVGRGYSSLTIADDVLYTMGDLADGQYAFAISIRDGAPKWKTRIGEPNRVDMPGTRGTPTIDGKYLYCMTTEATLLCLETESGEIKWQRDLVKDYDAKMMLAMGKWEWKFSESPLVDGSRVVVTPGSKKAAMVAFDKATGKEEWVCQTPELGPKGADGAAYSSAVISEAGGVRQYVQMVGRGLIGVEAESGKFLWGYNRVANKIANCSSPVVTGNFVFGSTAYQTGAALLELQRDDDGAFQVNEKYFLNHQKFQNHHGGFILHDGHIYGGHGHKMGLAICIRLEDGKIMWGPKRNRGKASAAVCFADGHLYFRYQNGLMVLIEAAPDEYREKGSFMIPDVRAESWSHPVICGGRLYLKEQERVLCYRISESGK